MKKTVVFRIICVLMVLSLFCSCNWQGTGDTSSASSDPSGVVYDPISLSAANAWSEENLRSSGIKIFTDSQTTDIKVDSQSDENVYISTRDSGVYASRDGGATFQNSSAGLGASNIDILAVDPNNNNYVLALAISGDERADVKGVYASSNAGRGWTKLSEAFIRIEDTKMQMLFDDTSYDSDQNNSSIVYLTGAVLNGNTVNIGENALYRSMDGGKTFSLASIIRPDSEIAVHPTRGYVYLTDSTGFYRSIDHGDTFEMMTGESCTHVFVSSQEPDKVVLAGINGVLISHDSGETFESTAGVVPNMSEAELYASPRNATNFMSSYENYDGSYTIRYSSDGGVTWQNSQIEAMPETTLDSKDYSVDFAWSYTDAMTVMMLYKNGVYKSTDGGANFSLCTEGLGGFDMSSSVSVNQATPEYLSLVIGTDTVAYSFDNGSSWRLSTVTNLTDAEFIASVYPMNKTTLMVTIGTVDSAQYAMAFLGVGATTLTRSAFDELKTPKLFGDANNKNTLFAGNFYSTDMGEHWQEMKGCDAVLTQNLVSPGEMFGVQGTKVVMSVDKGRSWIELFDAGESVQDIAYDYLDRWLYVVTGNSFYKRYSDGTVVDYTNKVPHNALDERILTAVAVDSMYPNIVYMGGAAQNYVNDCSVMISVDGGDSWRVICATSVNSETSNCAGGLQPQDLTVDPTTRVLTAYCGSYGTFKFDITKTEWGKQ